MQQTSCADRAQRGNILFLILLAVVLFAALSYAVTQGMRGGGKDGGDESAKAGAAYLLNYANNVAQAVQRITLINGCRYNQLSFENAVLSSMIHPNVSNFANSNAPPDFSCHIFHPDGGGLSYEKIPERYLDPSLGYDTGVTTDQHLMGYPIFGHVKIDHIGSEDSEIVMIVGYLKRAICDEIQDQVSPSHHRITVTAGSDRWYGANTEGNTGWNAIYVNGSWTNIKQWDFACGERSQNNPTANSLGAHFYKVLLPR